jgi:hypothetical protein
VAELPVAIDVAATNKEDRMTAVEVAVKALIELSHDTNADASVRCAAASNLLARNIDGELVFVGYDEQGQKVAG